MEELPAHLVALVQAEKVWSASSSAVAGPSAAAAAAIQDAPASAKSPTVGAKGAKLAALKAACKTKAGLGTPAICLELDLGARFGSD